MPENCLLFTTSQSEVFMHPLSVSAHPAEGHRVGRGHKETLTATANAVMELFLVIT